MQLIDAKVNKWKYITRSRCQEWELGIIFHSNKMQVLANMGITSRRSSHMSWIARRKPTPSMMQKPERQGNMQPCSNHRSSA